jgi:glycine cleavage system aminomethyltransferase T
MTHGALQRVIGTGSFVVRIAADDAERTAMESLGLCDLSGLRKLGLKGPDAESLLRNANLDVPTEIFDSRPFSDGGLIVRIGSDEFFLEGGILDECLTEISQKLDQSDGNVFHVDHQEATFLITGLCQLDVLAQTCGINFREAIPRRAIFTRIAGVSCCVLPNEIEGVPGSRIWVDPGYALYLWETLVEISESLGGSVIGAGCIFPGLLS